jgi:hypothetical protein
MDILKKIVVNPSCHLSHQLQISICKCAGRHRIENIQRTKKGSLLRIAD